MAKVKEKFYLRQCRFFEGCNLCELAVWGKKLLTKDVSCVI